MKKIIIILTLVFSTSFTYGQATWTGYLVDKMCSKRISTDAVKAAKHTKECLAEEHCSASGYGIAVDGKWYKFNKKGNELAIDLLKKTTRDKGIKITVTGAMKKSVIAVNSIAEAD